MTENEKISNGYEFSKAFLQTAAAQNTIAIDIAHSRDLGVFAADSMILTGKSHSFLQDSLFVSAYMEALGRFRNTESLPILTQLVWRKHVLDWALQNTANLSGSVAEFGVDQGFGADLMLRRMQQLDLVHSVYLFDTFEGIPSDLTDDGFPEGHFKAQNRYEAVKAALAPYDNVTFVRGLLPETLAATNTGPIRLAHIDLNNATSEVQTLIEVWPRLCVGGWIVFDDFGWIAFKQQQSALKRIFQRNSIPYLELPTGQALICKPSNRPLEVDLKTVLHQRDDDALTNWSSLLESKQIDQSKEFDADETKNALAYIENQHKFLETIDPVYRRGSDQPMFSMNDNDELTMTVTLNLQKHEYGRSLIQIQIDALQAEIDELSKNA